MSDCLILYLLDHKACIAEAESIEIPGPDDEWSIQKHIFSFHATGPQHFSAPHVNAWLHIIMTFNLMDEAISYTMFMFTFT